MCKIIWLDNDAKLLEPYAECLEPHGLEIELISDPAEALAKLREPDAAYECLLLDVRFYKITDLPTEANAIQSGFDFLDRMIEHGLQIPVCILSSYLNLKEHEERLEDYRKNEALRGISLDKFVGDTDSELFQSSFVNKLVEFVRDVEADKMAKGIAKDINLSELPRNPFQMRFQTYAGLSKSEQAQIRRDARVKVDDGLRKLAESQGVIWALYLGGGTKPERTATKVSDIATADEIRAMALDRNRIPFQFRANSRIEDNWGGCGGAEEQASYPKITLGSRSGIEGKDVEWKVHFDTGSFETFFSLEEFKDLGMFQSFPDWIDDAHKGQEFSYRRERVTFRMTKEDTTETYTATAWVNLVESWSESPFLAPCFKGCKTGQRLTNLGPRNCVNRLGLVGRSFLIGNALKAEYDPANPILKVTRL